MGPEARNHSRSVMIGLCVALLAAVAVLLVAGGDPPSASALTHHRPCPQSKKLQDSLAESRLLLVWQDVYSGDDWGCYKPSGRIQYLGNTEGPGGTAGLWGPFAIAGEVIAFTQSCDGTLCPSSCQSSCPSLDFPITVLDLRSGHRIHFFILSLARRATKVFVSPNGTAAWTTEPNALYVLDHSGERMIDAGPVAPRSVHFGRSVLHWTTKGITHTLHLRG